MARILVLNQYYSPDTAATGGHAAAIAEHLAHERHEVDAIVGQPSYGSDAQDAQAHEVRNGVRVTRISLGRRRGRERMVTRIMGYLRYLVGASVVAAQKKPEIVICFHTPPPLPLLAMGLCWRRSTRLVYIPQDIHPDILLASGVLWLPPGTERLWNAFNRAVLRRADRTIALSDGMRETLIAKGGAPDRVLTIPLWAEPELDVRPPDEERRSELGVAKKLAVLYAGNMGVMHQLEPVLQAAAELEHDDISFLFAGSGTRQAHWRQRTEELGLGNVTFLDYQFEEDFARLIAAADVALVSLDQGMERLAMPSRTFAFLAAGRPVIAHMHSEADVSKIVTTGRAGWQAWTTQELIDLLRRLRNHPEDVIRAGNGARRLFEERFRREAITARYGQLIHGLETSRAQKHAL
jgi:glycosyltransferase involved in cell wall biosynthesis